MVFSGSFDESFEKLAQQEATFFDSQFLSPVLAGCPVRVRIAGIVVTLEVISNKRKKDFTGWGIFKPSSYKQCRFVRNPTLAEREQYLQLFPCLTFILCRKTDNGWYGIPAGNDKRFSIDGLVPIALPEEVQLFDTVATRFDGKVCWFASTIPLIVGDYLREQLQQQGDPEKLERKGLTKQQKDAYFIAYANAEESKRDRNEDRIKSALERAGAKYHSYLERADTYSITYAVEGESFTSTVSKNDLQVQSAGICLSGGDRNFDLQTLVGTIRTGINQRHIVRVGDGVGGLSERRYQEMYGEDEDDY